MPPRQYMDNPHAKRILIVCDEGNNRSVTIAGQLKYWGHDCLCVGLNRNSDATIAGLVDWAQSIILTASDQPPRLERLIRRHWSHDQLRRSYWNKVKSKIHLWDLGPDKFPRPYNKELLAMVKQHIHAHHDELAPKKK